MKGFKLLNKRELYRHGYKKIVEHLKQNNLLVMEI